MTEAELRKECKLLTAMQKQYEDASISGHTTLLIQLLDSDVKHVYSKRLATRITKAIARAIEYERLDLLNRNKTQRHEQYKYRQ